MERDRSSSPKRNSVKVGPSWLSDLKKDGFAAIPDVISFEEVLQYHASMWSWMGGFGTGIKQNNPQTWATKFWPPSIRGLIQHFGIGHAQFVWKLRAELAVRKVFATIHKLDDSKETEEETQLVVSFDGACLAKAEIREVEHEKNSWAHIDQGPSSAGEFKMVQGLMTLTDAGPEKGGLIVYQNSHKLHGRFFKRFPDMTEKIGKGNWCKLEVKHRAWYFKHGCFEVQVTAPRGSLILWDSRTVHYAVRPKEWRPIPRAAIYLCYQPRTDGTDKQLVRKQKAFTERRMHTHYPIEFELFPERARDWGNLTLRETFKKQPTIQDSEMTPVMWKLAGF